MKRKPANSVVAQLANPENALWLLCFASMARTTIWTRKRELGQFAAVDSSAATQVIIVAIIGLFVIASPRLKQVIGLLKRTPMGLLLGYYIIGAVSTLWSVNPMFTLYRAGEAIIQILAVLIAMTYCKSFEQSEKRVLQVASLAMLLDAFGRLKLYGFALSLKALHNNTFSCIATMITVYCLAEVWQAEGERRRRLFRFMALALPLAILSTSGTANVAMVCAAVIGLTIRHRSAPIVFVTLTLASVMIFASGMATESIETTSAFLVPGKNDFQLQTMSGRTFIWQRVYEKFLQQPLIGFGFSAATRSLGVNTAHNIVLDALVSTGILGAVLLGYYLLVTGFLTLRHVRQNYVGAVGMGAVRTAAFVMCMGTPFVATYWVAPSFAFFCFASISVLTEVLGAPVRSPSKTRSSRRSNRSRRPVRLTIPG